MLAAIVVVPSDRLRLQCSLLLMAGVLAVSAQSASGEDFPSKPIRIVASESGGGNDLVARLMAQGMAAGLNQPVIVENRPAPITASIVARATPDGYTLLITGSSLWLSPFMRDHPAYDVVKDFSPVSLVTTAPLVLVVHPSVEAKSVKDLIALAKTKPGALNYASGAIGASSHLGPELFKAMAGIDIVRVPYKGAGPGVNGLIAGEVQMMVANAGTVMPHAKSGKLRALAVTSAQPSALVPGLPTVASTGLPGFEIVNLTAIFAPAKTPAAAVNRVNAELARFLRTPAAKERILTGLGVEAVGSSPAELMTTAKSEMARLGKVIRDLGIREE